MYLLIGCGAAAPQPDPPGPEDPLPVIRLAARTFAPAPGLDGALGERLRAAEATPLHALVQFTQPLIPKGRASFERQSGIQLLDAIPDHAYIAVGTGMAFLRPDLFREAPNLPRVHAVAELRPTDKIAPALLAGHISDHARLEGGRVAVTILLHADVDLDREIRSGVLSQLRVDERLPFTKGIRTELSTSEIRSFARHDVVKWIAAVPPPPEDDNDGIRNATGVDSESLWPPAEFHLTGQGVTLAQWETGVPGSHADLAGNVLLRNASPPAEVSSHATHVAGTAVGSGHLSSTEGGTPGQWRGVAPDARIRSYDTDHHATEYADATTSDQTGPGATIANYSWGRNHCHMVTPPTRCYGDESIFYDTVISGQIAPGMSATGASHRVAIFASVGNRGAPERHADNLIKNQRYDPGEEIFQDNDLDGLAAAPPDHRLLGTTVTGGSLIDFLPDERHADDGSIPGQFDRTEQIYEDGDKSGDVSVGDLRLGASPPSAVQPGDSDLSTPLRPFNHWANLRTPNAAKNTIVVGAYDIASGHLWGESSRGPTQDGRLKPDIVAPGSRTAAVWGIKSTLNDDEYGFRTGTSTATPAAAAVGALVTEWYRTACRDADPMPSTLKALLIHSAIDVTTIPSIGTAFAGPDYAYGYGKVHAPSAVGLVGHHVEGTVSSVPQENTYPITIGRVEDLKVTLAWDDPPPSVIAGVSPVSGLLQNDLDLELVAPDGKVYTPWQLDPEHPEHPAVASPGYPPTAVPAHARDRRNNVEQVLVRDAEPGVWTIRVLATALTSVQSYSLVSDLLQPELSACDSVPATDIWLRDNTADDGTAPSSGTLWLSPDVWNRLNDDGLASHENPRYGAKNHLYVQLRNRSDSDIARATSVDVWMAPAATGLSWPAHFHYLGRLPAPNLAPGGSRTVGPLTWEPPNPYPSSHFCLYVRAVNPQDPVTINETMNVAANTRNSNNIAWRNVNVVEASGTDYVTFLTRNLAAKQAEVEIELRLPDDMLAEVEVDLALAPGLYARWRAADHSGEGFERSDLPRPTSGELIPKVQLRLVEPTLRLGPMRYRPSQTEAVGLSFRSSTGREHEFPVDVVQRIDGNVVGGIRYIVRTGRR